MTRFMKAKVAPNFARHGTCARPIADRVAAIADVEKGFLAWNKARGKIHPGLAKRRQREADRFLALARQELAEMKYLQGQGLPANANSCHEPPTASWNNVDWELGQYGIAPRNYP